VRITSQHVAVAPRFQADGFVEVAAGFNFGKRVRRANDFNAAVAQINSIKVADHRLVGVKPAVLAVPVAAGGKHFGKRRAAGNLFAAVVNRFAEERLELFAQQADCVARRPHAEPVGIGRDRIGLG
jgi:hypothetical protein